MFWSPPPFYSFTQVVPVEPGSTPKAAWTGVGHLGILEASEEGKHLAFQQTTQREEVLGLHWTDQKLFPVQWVASDSVDWITWHGVCSKPEFGFLNEISLDQLLSTSSQLFEIHLVVLWWQCLKAIRKLTVGFKYETQHSTRVRPQDLYSLYDWWKMNISWRKVDWKFIQYNSWQNHQTTRSI